MSASKPTDGILPRQQANLLSELIIAEGSRFQGVVCANRLQGKSDLLRQIRDRLFDAAEGPIPILHSFNNHRTNAIDARYFLASFCNQVRAFLLRREELLDEQSLDLEHEIDRPGMPLSLSELVQTFLALPEDAMLEFAASVPSQFASKEKRPICLLFDDTETLNINSPFLTALKPAIHPWILTGRLSAMKKVAAHCSWSIIPLESFSAQEALLLAEIRCRFHGLKYEPQPWKEWIAIAGASLWPIQQLISAAAVRGQTIDSTKQLGNIYITELSGGTLGNFFADRWQRAVPDRRQRLKASHYMANLSSRGDVAPDSTIVGESIWDGLIAEEWATEAAVRLQFDLSLLERDWLLFSLASDSTSVSKERARARALQAFLYRVLLWQRRLDQQPLAMIRERISELVFQGWPKSTETIDSKIHFPRISSIAMESAGNADLFWCYGFKTQESGDGEIPIVMLIALCLETPSAEIVRIWHRQLLQESHSLALDSSCPSELWTIVPNSSLPASESFERRFSWDEFALFLESGKLPKQVLFPPFN
ncbi:MAG: hypothetical protein A3F68_12760 [Acidobacteria bacterium RIFCSPLOWO2_12_FULL_54_10]|nr:MAG: hypothetical protein A3F68_12760 [Acidobacteria bacterium RIFCSPLOWO2_12_FULL_54_10]